MRVLRLILGILAMLYAMGLAFASFVGNIFDSMLDTNAVADFMLYFIILYFVTGLIMVVCNKWQAFAGCITALTTSFAGVVLTLLSEQYVMQQFIIFVVLACVAAAGLFVWEFKKQ